MSPAHQELTVDLKSGIPIYVQLVNQLTYQIKTGKRQPGSVLPTVRQLAVDLEINPNTVVRAYAELEREGLIETRQGSGTHVATMIPEVSGESPEKKFFRSSVEYLKNSGSTDEGIRNALKEILDELET